MSYSDWPAKNRLTAGIVAAALTLCGGVATSILTAQSESERIADRRVREHESKPGHAYTLERVDKIDRRLGDVETDRRAIFVLLERLHEDVKSIRKELRKDE